MVLTTKHHSGFCLWPTTTTDFSIAGTPYKKDIVKQYVDACRKYDMKVGFYFSPEDFLFLHKQGHEIRRKSKHANISTNPQLLAHNKAQIKELFTNYGPIDVAFLDAFDNKLIRDYIHELQPNCLVTRGEMETPEQRIPNKPLEGPSGKPEHGEDDCGVEFRSGIGVMGRLGYGSNKPRSNNKARFIGPEVGVGVALVEDLGFGFQLDLRLLSLLW